MVLVSALRQAAKRIPAIKFRSAAGSSHSGSSIAASVAPAGAPVSCHGY